VSAWTLALLAYAALAVVILPAVYAALVAAKRADEQSEELRARIRGARDEGIPFAAIARQAGFSRERVRQLYAPAARARPPRRARPRSRAAAADR
jgi:hypothetical protein